MEEKGKVSMWLGRFSTIEELEDYVDLKYTEQDGWRTSEFMNDFNVDMDDIEENCIEKNIEQMFSNNISKLLKGCSYEEVVIKNVVDKIGGRLPKEYNTVVLIYNYEVDEVLEFKQEKLEYYCTIKYE